MSETENRAIGALPATDALNRLQAAADPDYEEIASALGEADIANLSLDQALEIHWPGHDGTPPVWKNSQAAYGFIPAGQSGTAAIVDAHDVPVDESLKGS